MFEPNQCNSIFSYSLISHLYKFCQQNELLYSRNLLWEATIANQTNFTLRRNIHNFQLLCPQKEIHRRYMDSKMCASFWFLLVWLISQNSKTHNKFPLYSIWSFYDNLNQYHVNGFAQWRLIDASMFVTRLN